MTLILKINKAMTQQQQKEIHHWQLSCTETTHAVVNRLISFNIEVHTKMKTKMDLLFEKFEHVFYKPCSSITQ